MPGSLGAVIFGIAVLSLPTVIRESLVSLLAQPRVPLASVIRMALLTTERIFWLCGAHTAEQTIGSMEPIPQTISVLPKSAVFCGTWS